MVSCPCHPPLTCHAICALTHIEWKGLERARGGHCFHVCLSITSALSSRVRRGGQYPEASTSLQHPIRDPLIKLTDPTLTLAHHPPLSFSQHTVSTRFPNTLISAHSLKLNMTSYFPSCSVASTSSTPHLHADSHLETPPAWTPCKSPVRHRYLIPYVTSASEGRGRERRALHTRSVMLLIYQHRAPS
jgi:hypothetical protein